MARQQGAVKFEPIHKVRQANLKKVIDARFDGNVSEAARVIRTSHTFMWQLMKSYRTIGEKSARNIERRLELGQNALDATMQRSETVTAQLGDGRQVSYRMVPRRALADLDADTDVIDACPDTEASAKTFSIRADKATAQDIVEIEENDLVFIDPKLPLLDRRLFVVKQKRGPALVLQALAGKVWSFRTTGEKRPRTYSAREVRFVGRVILVVHDLK